MKVAILLFNDFETLDVFGPVEIFGRLTDLYTIKFYSLHGGAITNQHCLTILSQPLCDIDYFPEIFLIPGGIGTRKEVENLDLINVIKAVSNNSKYVLTVCTGSALLARTGLLNGKEATSNKKAFDWVISNGDKVNWNRQARWVIADKFYTSGGVSAGIDMALGFLSDRYGSTFAKQVATEIEYHWINNKDGDIF